MPNAFTIALARMEVAVDQEFGEPVDLLPRIPANYSGSSQPDPDRPAVLGTIGVYEKPGEVVTGAGGVATGTLSTRIAESKWWLSITIPNMRGLTLRKDDLVYFSDRGEYGAVTFVEPFDDQRPNVHLVKVPPSARPAPIINTEQELLMVTQDAEGTVS